MKGPPGNIHTASSEYGHEDSHTQVCSHHPHHRSNDLFMAVVVVAVGSSGTTMGIARTNTTAIAYATAHAAITTPTTIGATGAPNTTTATLQLIRVLPRPQPPPPTKT